MLHPVNTVNEINVLTDHVVAGPMEGLHASPHHGLQPYRPVCHLRVACGASG